MKALLTFVVLILLAVAILAPRKPSDCKCHVCTDTTCKVCTCKDKACGDQTCPSPQGNK